MNIRRRSASVPVLQHVLSLLAEMDLRYQQRFDAQGQALTAALLAAEKAVQTALTAAEKAVVKAENATEKRFESVNEFRQALTDQTATFPSRVELGALAQRVTDLATRLDKTEGHTSGMSDSTKLLIQMAGLVVAVFVAALTLYLGLKN